MYELWASKVLHIFGTLCILYSNKNSMTVMIKLEERETKKVSNVKWKLVYRKCCEVRGTVPYPVSNFGIESVELLSSVRVCLPNHTNHRCVPLVPAVRPVARGRRWSRDLLSTYIVLGVDSNFISYLMRAYFSRTLFSSLRILCVTTDLHTVIPRWTSTKRVRCPSVYPAPNPSPLLLSLTTTNPLQDGTAFYIQTQQKHMWSILNHLVNYAIFLLLQPLLELWAVFPKTSSIV
jgi:hypothetical protein